MEQKEENFVCAFTGKAVRLAEMMTQAGWDCVFYHNGDTDVTCCKTVQLLNHEEFWDQRRAVEPDDNKYISDDLFNHDKAFIRNSLNPHIDRFSENINGDDVFCHVFGATYYRLSEAFPRLLHVETGIGYENPWTKYRIYEAYSWLHYCNAMESKTRQSNYEFVIPNYYREEDWRMEDDEGYVLWGNRIEEAKGIHTLIAIAKAMPHIPFVVAGAGRMPQELHGLGNVFYVGVLKGEKRKEVWSKAMCTIMPTTYFEPFGGFHVEGMLCGVPAITSDSGAFTETVIPGVNGYRCKTLGDWIKAIELSKQLDKQEIRDLAISKYTYGPISQQYTAAFNQLLGLYGEGWSKQSESFFLDQQISLKKE